MYMDYSKLWRVLVDKKMSKTDLMEVTGISSRVLAKLSRNETVTTDTVARICAALSCDVGDVMECVSEERLSVYAAYRKYGECVEENDRFRAVRFTLVGQPYTVYRSKETASKATHVHCGEDGAIYLERFYPTGYGSAASERSLLLRPERPSGGTVIVLIKGKPAVITGLDENGFVSSRGVRKSRSDVYVMSEAAFKLITPQVP